jgi:hypothetical protein
MSVEGAIFADSVAQQLRTAVRIAIADHKLRGTE